MRRDVQGVKKNAIQDDRVRRLVLEQFGGVSARREIWLHVADLSSRLDDNSGWMDNNLRLGVVRIVEWLRASDVIRTGWDLFNEVEPLGIVSSPPVPVTFHCVETRAQFLDLLNTFDHEYRKTGRSPV